MRQTGRAADARMPSPRLERAVGLAAKAAVLTLPLAWGAWLLGCHLGSPPAWPWVAVVGGAVAVGACWRPRPSTRSRPAAGDSCSGPRGKRRA
jgi:hypothetical protein